MALAMNMKLTDAVEKIQHNIMQIHKKKIAANGGDM